MIASAKKELSSGLHQHPLFQNVNMPEVLETSKQQRARIKKQREVPDLNTSSENVELKFQDTML